MTAPTRLAFFASALDTVALADAAPLWVQVLKTGTWKHPQYGTLTITAADLAEFKANFDAGARQFVYADYDHGTRRITGDGNAIVAGEVKALEVRADGAELWALYEPTEPARAKLANREYRYTSADFETGYRDKVSGKSWGKVLCGFALTNRPFIETMAPLTLGEAAGAACLFAEYPTEAAPALENLMPIKAILNLADDASEADVEARVSALLTESQTAGAAITTLAEVRTALALGEDADVLATVRSLAEQNATLQRADRERSADALLTESVAGGKITPAERPTWRAQLLSEHAAVAESAKTLLGALGKKVPLGERRADPSGGATPSTDPDTQIHERAMALLSEDATLKALGERNQIEAYKLACQRAGRELATA